MYAYASSVFREAGIPENKIQYAIVGTGSCELFTSCVSVSQAGEVWGCRTCWGPHSADSLIDVRAVKCGWRHGQSGHTGLCARPWALVPVTACLCLANKLPRNPLEAFMLGGFAKSTSELKRILSEGTKVTAGPRLCPPSPFS